jgi:hypothetical protein
VSEKSNSNRQKIKARGEKSNSNKREKVIAIKKEK